MANEFVILPDDSTNLGKRVRTNDRIVSATTVHEHYWIGQDPTNDIQARVVSAAPSANAAGYVVWPAITTMSVSNAISGVVSVSGPVSGNVAVSGAVSGVVSISGTVAIGATVVPGTGATNLGKAFDAAAGATDTGVAMLGVRNDSNATIGGTNLDYTSLNTDLTGSLKIIGKVAHDSAADSRPVGIGFEARTTNPTAVSDGDAVRAMADKLGRAVSVLNQIRELAPKNRTVVTNVTETQILAAGATGVFHDLTYLKCSNESQVSTRVDVRASTASAVVWTCNLVPGGTTNDVWVVPLTQTSSATDWTAQLSVTATVYVTIQAVKNL